MRKHTPGPWDVRITVSRHGDTVYRIEDVLRDVDDLEAAPSQTRHQANRRLIEAAPRMLEALEAARWQMAPTAGDWVCIPSAVFEQIVKATRQALGEDEPEEIARQEVG